MAFTSAYWALGALKPDILAFVGCDMVYPTSGAATHFYGTGAADPLRNDITLQSLEAKSTRLFYLAAQQQCLCLNLSTADQSRMVFPRVSIAALEQFNQQDYHQHTELVSQMFDLTPIELTAVLALLIITLSSKIECKFERYSKFKKYLVDNSDCKYRNLF